MISGHCSEILRTGLKEGGGKGKRYSSYRAQSAPNLRRAIYLVNLRTSGQHQIGPYDLMQEWEIFDSTMIFLGDISPCLPCSGLASRGPTVCMGTRGVASICINALPSNHLLQLVPPRQPLTPQTRPVMPITQEQLDAHDADREVGRPHLNTPNANNVPGGASIGEGRRRGRSLALPQRQSSRNL